MSKWRPEDWDTEKIWQEAYDNRNEWVRDFEHDLIEAGADAMYEPAYDKGKSDGKKELLEALRKDPFPEYRGKGVYRGFWHFSDTDKTKWMVCDNLGTYPLDVGVKGTLVFIPDDTEDISKSLVKGK